MSWKLKLSTIILVSCCSLLTLPGYAICGDRLCECVEYARAATGIIIYGDGYTWDDLGPSLGYQVGTTPVVGGIMNFERAVSDPNHGHVGKVISYKSDGDYWKVTVRQANWPGTYFKDLGCTNVSEKEFRFKKNDTNVHYIAPPKNNKFINKKSSKCIDVKGGSTDDWAHLIEYTCSNDDNMKWNLVGVNVGKVYTDSAYYKIVNKKSGKCMDTEGGATKDWTKVIQYHCGDDDNMKWQLDNSGGSYHRLINKKSGTCLDLEGGNTANWTDLIIYKCSKDKNMYWNLNPLY